MRVFIDSNIPMYVAGTDHRNKEPARRFLARVQDGEIEGCTSTEVLQEILYRYTAVGRRDLAREVYGLFVQLCPVIFDVTLADTDRALTVLMDTDRISARDAVHAAVMLNHDVALIATFDQGFERAPHVDRVLLP